MNETKKKKLPEVTIEDEIAKIVKKQRDDPKLEAQLLNAIYKSHARELSYLIGYEKIPVEMKYRIARLLTDYGYKRDQLDK